MIRMKLAALSLIGGAGLVMAGAPASHAAVEAGAAAAAGCKPNIGYTHKQGNSIVGYGSIGNCRGSVSITLQRKRWWGWQDLASGTITSSRDTYVSKTCRGTFTYRAIETWRSPYGNGFRQSNHFRTSC